MKMNNNFESEYEGGGGGSIAKCVIASKKKKLCILNSILYKRERLENVCV